MIKKIMTYIKGFVYGVVLGMTTLIPGISAGTIGMVFNVYDQFFQSVEFDLNALKKHISFIIPFGVGCLAGVFLFSKLILFLLDNFGQIMYFSFMGMILGCIPLVITHIKPKPFRFRNITAFAVTLILMIVISLTGTDTHANPTLAQAGGLSPGLVILLFVAGFLSAIAMLVPGISGSLVMLILGTYTIAAEAMVRIDLLIIVILGAGIILGILAGIKIIKTLMELHTAVFFSVILGFILGAVFTLHPGFVPGFQGTLAIVLAVVFAILPYLISKRKGSQ